MVKLDMAILYTSTVKYPLIGEIKRHKVLKHGDAIKLRRVPDDQVFIINVVQLADVAVLIRYYPEDTLPDRLSKEDFKAAVSGAELRDVRWPFARIEFDFPSSYQSRK